MTIEEYLVNALDFDGIPVVMGSYLGNAERYICIRYDTASACDGDDCPTVFWYEVEVYYICPLTENSMPMRKRIEGALVGAGFSPPQIARTGEIKAVTQSVKQGWVFVTELYGDTDWEV